MSPVARGAALAPRSPGDDPTLADRQHLQLARRHIAEGEARVQRLRELIGDLELAGRPTELAESLLRSFIETLEQMRRHRDYLETNAARE